MADNTVNVQDLVAEISAKARFQKLDADRSSVLDRARECAKLTIPSVMPDSGHSETAALDTPYQSVGSKLVNNLASKLLLSLLPPNTSFFRLLPAPELKEQISEDNKASEELDSKFMLLEQEMVKTVERQALRVPVFTAVKSLIITGNSLLYAHDNGLKSFNLANYVIVRDFKGNPVEIITKEVVTKHTIPDDILSQLEKPEDIGDTTELILFTRAVKRFGKWYEWQEVEDIFIEGSDTAYTDPNELPFIPLRWTAINGEHYGRGLVEQYLGDFRSLEGLRQLILEASAVMGRVIFGKRPGGLTDIDDLNEAENGICISGDLENDITTLVVGKTADLQVPMQLAQDLIRSLEQSFLAASSTTRQAERVTALEIRYMASELENSLGGIYSILSLEFQRPLAYLLLKANKVKLKEGVVDLVIVTGIEALGRNLDLDKLRQFNGLIQELGSPELVLQKMNIDKYIAKIGNALSLDTTDLIKTEEQIQQEQQAMQEQQLMAQGAGNLVNQATMPQQQ